MNSGKVLLGVVAGVAAGALVGVLFAPDSGWNTRKRISKKAEKYMDDLKEKFGEFVETVTSKIEDAKEEVSEFASQSDLNPAKHKKDIKASAG